MEHYFVVGHLDVERLLVEWRWLCPQPMVLIARSAFGDLFLRDESGKIFKLDISIGQMPQVAPSEAEFREGAASKEKRDEWFAEKLELAAAKRGLNPNQDQCIAFKVPLIFAEGGGPQNAYLGSLYEQVAFLGNLNHQLSQVPDGTKVQFRLQDQIDEPCTTYARQEVTWLRFM